MEETKRERDEKKTQTGEKRKITNWEAGRQQRKTKVKVKRRRRRTENVKNRERMKNQGH
jgi:hypothetical protein